MEGFVAVVSSSRKPLDIRHWSRRLANGAIQAYGILDRDLTSFGDDNIVFVCAQSRRVSDIDVVMSDVGFVYVSGNLAATRDSSTKEVENSRGAKHISGKSAILARALAGQGGLDNLVQVSGSFHGIVHRDEQTLVVTDRLGTRPLFIYHDSELLFIASDIRLLLELPEVDRTLDLEAYVQLVHMQTVLEDRTLYQNVKVIPPATRILVDHLQGIKHTDVYWVLKPLPAFASQEEAIETTAQAFCAATERVLRGSELTGVLLSGGLDSRMLVASMMGDAPASRMAAATFGPGTTDESIVAQQIASMARLPWVPIQQTATTYWQRIPQAVYGCNGLYSLYHAHTFHSASRLAQAGFDTILNGWGFDLLYSGSYFPKASVSIAGRQLPTYRLQPLRTGADVVSHLYGSLDLQQGCFSASMLSPRLRELWKTSGRSALERLVGRAQQRSEIPYDWIDQVLFGFGIAKFRSYPMVAGIRTLLRERNPMFESDLIEVYQRLPHQWRFLGPIFRRALFRLHPVMARIVYSNIGVSPLARPAVQAIAHNIYTTWRAQRDRLQHASARIGLKLAAPVRYGGYVTPGEVAAGLATEPSVGGLRELLLNGWMADARLVSPDAITDVLHGRSRTSADVHSTLVSLASAALWFERYPAQVAL